MADFSSFTHKWRATPAGSHQNEGNKVNKRNRQPVSCAPCRNRKLKCDRGHPCDACVKRNDDDACVYGKTAMTTPATTTTTTTTRRDDSKSNNLKAQERLRHLEELVKQMIGSEGNVPTPHTPPTDDPQQQQRPPEGSLNKDGDGTKYTGSTHWATVLDQIQELRNTLSPTANSTDEDAAIQNELGRAGSLFAAPQPPPLHVLLQRYLPPREECNRYLSTYFNAKYMTIPFVHTSQFKRQYEAFWDNQLETSPVWISMLFSIMCMADGIRRAPLSLYRADANATNFQMPFMTASAQCLILGDYARPQQFLCEALAMHSQCKYAVTLDPSHELGMIFSILARHAYRMGYHREPAVFENQFTVFEAEMRRRFWHLIRQFDLMVSFQLGLPATIQPDSADIRPPTHLLDEDFDEDTTVLPTPRPDTEPTQMLYLITKARLMEVYGKVCQHTLSFPKQPVTKADITALDTAITQTIESIPLCLRARPMSLSYADPPNATMTRSNLMFLGEKTRCILHRKYMIDGPDADESRRKCIKSSKQTITHFLDLHAELQPGGQLFNDRWMMTSFTINDFLLALMVLCLSFSLSRKRFIADGGDAERWLEECEATMQTYLMLEKAQAVCAEYGTRAREARHVAEAVGVVLSKLRPKNSKARPTAQAGWVGRMPDDAANGGYDLNGFGLPGLDEGEKMPIDIKPLSINNTEYPMEDLSAMPQFGNLPSTITPASSFDPSASSSGPLTFSNPTEPSPSSSWDLMDGPLPNILEGPEQIDWVQFDQFLSTYGVQHGLEEEIL